MFWEFTPIIKNVRPWVAAYGVLHPVLLIGGGPEGHCVGRAYCAAGVARLCSSTSSHLLDYLYKHTKNIAYKTACTNGLPDHETWCSKHVDDTKNWIKTLILKVYISWFTLRNYVTVHGKKNRKNNYLFFHNSCTISGQALHKYYHHSILEIRTSGTAKEKYWN
jgi:hypothetical protein